MKKTNTCRCCLSSGCYKSLTDYLCDGTLENYGEMLTKTFNLSLNCLKKFICEDCITKLQDAAEFKQQILEADESLRGCDDGFSCTEMWPDLKTEDEIFHIKTEPMEEASSRNEDGSNASENENSSHVINDNKLKVKRIQCKKTLKVKCKPRKVKKLSNPEKEAQKEQLANSIKLISYSNICLFKSLRTRFACYVCNEKFFEIKKLRGHSKVHSIDDFKRKIRRLRGKSYENVDISNLTCNICSDTCTDLDILRQHLNQNHEIDFGDVNHVLIPYKLEEGFRCEVCRETFHTFTRLSMHMNSHATSNVCETCGMAFFNRVSLRNHIRSVHRDQKCALCSLKFPTSTKLVAHKQKVHNAAPAKHYCQHCNQIFKYSYLIKNHMVEKHGAKSSTVECVTCKKVFKDANCLKTHFRGVHLNERTFSCSLCELMFFTSNGRMRHEKTHLSGRLFSCHLCETKFKCKDSIRRHMKAQHANKAAK